MSQELERVYTINLGKALLSVDTHRATRVINMIREFARRHMKVEDIKHHFQETIFGFKFIMLFFQIIETFI